MATKKKITIWADVSCEGFMLCSEIRDKLQYQWPIERIDKIDVEDPKSSNTTK